MAKFYGSIGYAELEETSPGVTEEKIVRRNYYGDVLRNTRRLEKGEGLNDDLTVSNQFSICADAYAYEHFYAIRFIEWMGVSWKVSSVEVQRPRLILNVGGVYNERQIGAS